MYTYFFWTFYPKLPGKLIHFQVNREEIGFFYSISIYFFHFAGKPLAFCFRTPPNIESPANHVNVNHISDPTFTHLMTSPCDCVCHDKEWLRGEMEEMAGGYCKPRVCLYYPASVHKVGPHNLSPIVKLINTQVYSRNSIIT
jgi:hypothetical protein